MEKVMTPEFRVSFPSVFKATAFNDKSEPKYKLVMLFPKSDKLKELKALAQKAVAERWPDKAKRPKNLKHPFRDGDEEKPDLDGYPDHIFISASSKMKPGVVDQNVQPIISEEEFYAGCYARATLTAYAYSQGNNHGVAFGLQNVQKLRDGEEFSGRAKAEEEFDAVDIGPETGGDAPEVQQEEDIFA